MPYLGPAEVCPTSRRSSIRGLNDTIGRLAELRHRFSIQDPPTDNHLTAFQDFGSNPGALRGWTYLPANLRRGAPLVVILHGCTQSAGSYDRGSGWSAAADEHGFALLFPEQQRENNPNLCFNWFTRQDARRGRGEAHSIHQMVETMQARHQTDPARVFVTGLSAGGAMTAVMLATYPEMFAGGAIIAGLPFGTAQSLPEAFDRMRGHGGAAPGKLAQLVRAASSHKGPWPTLSVWHGTADGTVDPGNAAAILDQWRALHGAPDEPCRTEMVNGYPHRVWCDAGGREVIEEYAITGMGHGTPLSTSAAHAGETAGPYMLEAGISSTRHALRFWGIAEALPGGAQHAEPVPREVKRAEPIPAATERPPSRPAAPASHVQKTIEDALRAAGLLDR